MAKKGFALLELIIVVAIVAVAFGGGFYLKGLNDTRDAATTGASDVSQARQAAAALASSTSQEQNALDAIAPASAPVPASAPTPVSSKTTSTDPLAGLGSDIYASGILPLGDGKYVTTGPKKGYIYLCNVMSGGGGSQVNGPWIGTSTWNSNAKTAVEGATSWPNASVSIAVNGSTRTITTNDLPTVGTTGNFPIQSSDPAHQYDANPNSVEVQNDAFSLPANPTAAASPSCIYGEVGVMTNGVLLLDGFDELYHDAAAHEIQDSCDGHPHEGGVYHYHSLSSCIPDAAVTNVIGWAFDGFPITGPEISTGRYLTTADLDECHGITSPVMLNGKLTTTYHYVMTQDFPYSVSCFRGKSYEPKPGGMQTSQGSSGSNQAQTAGQGTGQQPPQAAITACNGQSSGASCSFTAPQGMISGACQTPPGQSSLACIPSH